MLMGWLYVFLATIAEMVGVYGLSLYSERRTLRNFLIYYSGIAGSFGLVYLSFNYLSMSIAYTVFTGVGTAGAVILNIVLFGESKNLMRILSLCIIIAGVVGLKVVEPHDTLVENEAIATELATEIKATKQ